MTDLHIDIVSFHTDMAIFHPDITYSRPDMVNFCSATPDFLLEYGWKIAAKHGPIHQLPVHLRAKIGKKADFNDLSASP